MVYDKERKFIPGAEFFKHPLTLLILLYLIANILSTVFSTMPLVSIKALIVKICYVVVFYFIVQAFIKSSFESYAEMIKIYGICMTIVVVYSLAGHFQFGLTKKSSGFISYPFFADHTIYSAALAFIIPAFIAFFFFPKVFEIKAGKRAVFFLVMLLFFAALYFSFGRGAWISLMAALMVFVLFMLRIRFYQLILLISVSVLLLFYNREAIVSSFEKNRINSNEINAGLFEQVFSLTNITNDLSNAERINRWSSALNMFVDRPWFGFGPGTYQFQYFDYQRKEDMTPISNLNPIPPGATTYFWSPVTGLKLPQSSSAYQGSGGSAHSEYFLALSETGILSVIAFIGLLLVALKTALRIFSTTTKMKMKIIAMMAMLGLVTYFVHGLFNNFLDDCKLAFLFWSSLSVIAGIASHSYVQNEK